MSDFLVNNSYIFLLLIIWSIIWKGWALWIAALRRHKWWFIVLLFVNTLGILEILYIFYLSKRRYKTARVYTQTHGTVGAIIERHGKICLVKEANGSVRGQWNQPAGWIEVGDNPLDAIKTEVKEETGFAFEPTHLIGVYSIVKEYLAPRFKTSPHALKLIFKGRIAGGSESERHKDEIIEVGWFTPEEIDKMTPRELRDLDIKDEVRDYFAGREYPLALIKHTIAK